MKPKALEADEEDEEQGAKHYAKRAKQFPKFRKKFHKMRKDEKKHSGLLEQMTDSGIGPSDDAKEKMFGKIRG